MTVNRMHDLLDQLTQWIADVRAELPLPTGSDEVERVTGPTSPVSLGRVLQTLKTTPQLPAGMRRSAPVTEGLPLLPEPTIGQVILADQLAQQRLANWLQDAYDLDPHDLEAWSRHRRLLKPFIQSGYGIEAMDAFEQFTRIAFDADIRYDAEAPEGQKFSYIIRPESDEERARHPY